MDKAYFILLLFISYSMMLFSQNGVEIISDTTSIGSEYSTSLKKPIIIDGFKFLKNDSDFKLFVFNEQSFNYFQELRKLLKEKSGDDLAQIIEEYNKIIANNHVLYDKLSKKNREQSEFFNNTISNLEFSVKNLEKTVNLTQDSLLNANNTLDIATGQLKEHRKKQFWKNFGQLGTGAAIGLLLGVLIIN